MDAITDRRDWHQVLGRDQSARWAFRAMLVFSVFVFVIIGRRQWFIRDDWALILTRRKMAVDSWTNSLFIAQDGINTPEAQNFKLVPWESIRQAVVRAKPQALLDRPTTPG